MARKRGDYLAAGVRFVWYVDLERRVVTAHADPHSSVELTERDLLPADPVLPGFALPLREQFSELDRQA